MPTKRIKHQREPQPTQYPAQFSFMTTAIDDTHVRTIARNSSRPISGVLREAVHLGIAAMIERGDLLSPAQRARRSGRTITEARRPRAWRGSASGAADVGEPTS